MNFPSSGLNAGGLDAPPECSTSPSEVSVLASSLYDNVSPSPPSNGLLAATHPWVCNVDGCGSVTFGRRTELLRHQKKHFTGREFSCVAEHCRRTGQYGFTRKDKLIDHMLAGHHDDELFACPNSGCARSLPRSLLLIHTQQDIPATKLGLYRVCPMPKCSFRIHAWRKSLDELQAHIIEQHNQEGRKRYAGTLKDRGYEPMAVNIIRPVCLHASRSHEGFQVHLLTDHGHISPLELDAMGSINGNMQPPSLAVLKRLSAIPLVRQERRVILSLWPQFEACPVWDDVKCQSIGE